MSISYHPQWLDDETSWRSIYANSEWVPVDQVRRARGYNVMILDILNRDMGLRASFGAPAGIVAIAVNWAKSGEGLPRCLFPEIEGARYTENKAELKRLGFATIEVVPAPKLKDRSSQDRTAPKERSKTQGTELAKAMERIRNLDPRCPTSISEIPRFPFSNFREMERAVATGKFVIAKFSFHQDLNIFLLVASRICLFFYLVSMITAYVVPLVCVILAFTVSHWFWLGLAYFFIGASMTTFIWTKSILRAASRSEPEFCFLFYTSKIAAYDLISYAEYEWQQLMTQDPDK